MTAENLLFAILREQVCGAEFVKDEKNVFTTEICDEIYHIAKTHDLAHLVGQGMTKLGVLGNDEVSSKLKQAAMQAVFRYVQINHTYVGACQLLEQESIPFIPLKGSVLRDYYPEPWMRTSCDIDILVHEEHLEQAIEAFTQKLNYANRGRSYHDVSLFSPTGVHLELHFETIDEGNEKPERREVLSKIWDNTTPAEGKTYQRLISDELFYFYHIAHMATHFEAGGCGIRPFLDLWILDHKMPDNREKRDALLEKGKLLTFANASRKLSEMWFSNTQTDSITQQMAAFILNGGSFGTNASRAAVEQSRTGNRLVYLIKKRVFLSYDFMKTRYPILKKHKWLLPVYQVIRWVQMLGHGKLKGAVHELKDVSTVSSQECNSAAQLLEYLDL